MMRSRLADLILAVVGIKVVLLAHQIYGHRPTPGGGI